MSTRHRHGSAAPDVAALHTEAASRLAVVGQRFTGNRRQLVDALAHADHPLSIPELLQATGDVAQSSAYRNLSVLERAGVVAKVVTNDEWARYELTEDLTGHHHHLVCGSCGAVRDVVVPGDVEEDLDRALSVLAKREGFVLQHHRLDLVGVCKKCS